MRRHVRSVATIERRKLECSQGEQSVWWLGRMDRAPCSCHRLRERRVLRRGVAVAGHNVLLCRISQVRTQLCNLPNDRSVAKNERPYRRGYLDPTHRPLRLPTRGLSLCCDRPGAVCARLLVALCDSAGLARCRNRPVTTQPVQRAGVPVRFHLSRHHVLSSLPPFWRWRYLGAVARPQSRKHPPLPAAQRARQPPCRGACAPMACQGSPIRSPGQAGP